MKIIKDTDKFSGGFFSGKAFGTGKTTEKSRSEAEADKRKKQTEYLKNTNIPKELSDILTEYDRSNPKAYNEIMDMLLEKPKVEKPAPKSKESMDLIKTIATAAVGIGALALSSKMRKKKK